MSKRDMIPSFNTFCEIARLFATSMNDYLYVIDLTNDTYFITENALDRFAFPSSKFHNVLKTFHRFIYHEDVDMVLADIRDILSGKTTSNTVSWG